MLVASQTNSTHNHCRVIVTDSLPLRPPQAPITFCFGYIVKIYICMFWLGVHEKDVEMVFLFDPFITSHRTHSNSSQPNNIIIITYLFPIVVVGSEILPDPLPTPSAHGTLHHVLPPPLSVSFRWYTTTYTQNQRLGASRLYRVVK